MSTTRKIKRKMSKSGENLVKAFGTVDQIQKALGEVTELDRTLKEVQEAMQAVRSFEAKIAKHDEIFSELVECKELPYKMRQRIFDILGQ